MYTKRSSNLALNLLNFFGITELAGGHYYHFGVKHCVEQCLACDPKLQQLNKLNLQVNIDGLPLFKSSSMQLWPIFGLIQKSSNSALPFTIGIYAGQYKQNNPVT